MLVARVSHFLMTTPNSTISEPFKLLRIAKAFMVWQIAPWRKRRFWVWLASDVSSRIRAAFPSWPLWSTCPKTVEIIFLNGMHTNTYTGPRLRGFAGECPVFLRGFCTNDKLFKRYTSTGLSTFGKILKCICDSVMYVNIYYVEIVVWTVIYVYIQCSL